MNIYSPRDAWEAFDAENYKLAAHIWLTLFPTAEDVDTLMRFQHGYLTVLMAQNQYQEASALLNELYESTQDCVCLHQLGCLARQQGHLDKARTHFMAEQACLKHTEYLPLALNAYELGMIAFQQQKIEVACHYARLSLTFARKSLNALAEGYAYYLFGELRQVLGEPEKAQACWRAAQKAWSSGPSSVLRESGEVRLATLVLQGFPLTN